VVEFPSLEGSTSLYMSLRHVWVFWQQLEVIDSSSGSVRQTSSASSITLQLISTLVQNLILVLH